MADPIVAEERTGLLRSLYFTIFLTSTAFGTVTFLLPVYAAGLGASYIALGVIGAVGSVVYTVMTFLSGVLLDRFERVRFYVGFTVIGMLVVFLFALTTKVSDVIMVRGLLGVASGAFWVTASTLTADISPPELLTQSVGRYNLSWILGFVVGPFLGGLISDSYGFPALFIILSFLVLLSTALIWTRLAKRLELRNRSESRRFNFSTIRGILLAYATLLPYAVVLGIYMAILPGHMGELGISASAIGLLLTMTNGVRGLGFFNSERWVMWGTKKSLGLAAFLMTGALFMLSFSSTTLEFVAPLALYGLAGGIITPVILDYIAHRTPREVLGTAMGLHECVYGVGMTIGPMVGGVIAEAFQPSTLYLLLAALATLILPLSLGLDESLSEGEM
ncbi:MFS transporter [Candidatus Bathyarchaeota archaeon]|nr:MAG: MFS transporter [Candidatus Bathyarchaeota archaeon]